VAGHMIGFDDYKKQAEQYQANADITKSGMKYWVFAVSKGHWVNIGKKDTESEAYEMAYSEVPDKMFEVFPTNTDDIAEAHRRWKKHLLERNHDLDAATSLISRKPAQEQKKKAKSLGFLDSI